LAPLSRQALFLNEPLSRWDYLVEPLLIGLLAFAPFAFGGVTAWAGQVVLCLIVAMVFCLAGKLLFQPRAKFVWSLAYVPIVLFVGFVAFQLVPLPSHVVASISPATVQTRTDLLGDLPDAPALLRSMTLTFYELATRQGLRMVIAVAAVFVVVVNVYRRSDQIKRLLLAVAIIGAAVAAMAAYQNLTGSRQIYGIVTAAHPNSGPFLNHSHFGQFMNLSIGAMLALLLVTLRERSGGGLDGGVGSVMLLTVGIILAAGTIFLSLTRGGVMSLVVASGVTGLFLAWRRGTRTGTTLLVMLAIAVVLCVLLAAFATAFERVATLRNVGNDNGDRLQIVRDMAVAWRRFPLVGMGLGTHEFVFPMFDTSTLAAHATHAENEYAQLMEETGGIGVGLCLLFVAIIAGAYFRVTARKRLPIYAAVFGLGYGLLAILIHSTSDFGQHLPANACLTAVFAGLIVCLARLAAANRETGVKVERHFPLPLVVAVRVIVILLAIGVFAWALRGADRDKRLESQWAQARLRGRVLEKIGWARATPAEYAGLIRSASAAVDIAPDDVVKVYWLNLYRWKVLTGATKRFIATPDTLDVTRHIVHDLQAARPMCPTFGPTVALAGELEEFVLDEPQGSKRIRLGYRLDPNYPTTCFAAAALDARSGNWDQSIREARRALALDLTLQTETLKLYVTQQRPDLAYAVVSGDRKGLIELSNLLPAGEPSDAWTKRCRAEADSLLRTEAAQRGASGDALAEMAEVYAKEGNDRAAADCYERALVHEYNRADWHMRLAELLNRAGRYDDAEREARVCLRLRPESEAAQTLIASMAARQREDR
jgi:tetratricopeptide (TPR) repeat protein